MGMSVSCPACGAPMGTSPMGHKHLAPVMPAQLPGPVFKAGALPPPINNKKK